MLGRRARGRRKTREPGRGHDDQDRPAIIAGGSRRGGVVGQAPRDCTVKPGQKAVAIAGKTGRRLSPDSASSDRALQGSAHDFVKHTKTESARGDGQEKRAEGLCSLLTPSLRVLRGLSTTTLPGYLGFLQCRRNVRQLHAFEQAEMSLSAALDPAVASRARTGDFVRCLDHFDLLQTARN